MHWWIIDGLYRSDRGTWSAAAGPAGRNGPPEGESSGEAGSPRRWKSAFGRGTDGSMRGEVFRTTDSGRTSSRSVGAVSLRTPRNPSLPGFCGRRAPRLISLVGGAGIRGPAAEGAAEPSAEPRAACRNSPGCWTRTWGPGRPRSCATGRKFGGGSPANRRRPPPLARSSDRTLASVTYGLWPGPARSRRPRGCSAGRTCASPPTEIQSAVYGLVSSTLPSRP